VDAEYGSFSPGSSKCTPLSSIQYVGTLPGPPPASATCVHVQITTNDNTVFARVPILGIAEVSATAGSSAGQISPNHGAGTNVGAAPTPTAAPWDAGSGEGYTIWAGNRADSTVLSVGSPVLFFADSGWDSGNDVQTACGPCQYQATQDFKGWADPQCFTEPLPSTCTGPNGALGNAAASLQIGSEIRVVVVSSIDHVVVRILLQEITSAEATR
jgi:hypothetical protein